MDDILRVIRVIAFGIGVAGTFIIVYGALLTAVAFIRVESNRIFKHVTHKEKRSIRQRFGAFILLGLEFFIAADIIKTIMKPTLLDVAILGAIVIIRTLIGYFLNKEIADAVEQETAELEMG